MDINEVSEKQINRHPWELSRTKCVLREILPAISEMGSDARFVSIGAGDMYFDKHILDLKKKHILYAIDIGYDTEKIELVREKSDRIKMHTNFDNVEGEVFDYALMLDSLEYMQDDRSYLVDLSARIKCGGYMFFTLPAFQFLYSKHDEIVGNLRRYSIENFKELIERIPGIELVCAHYFYHSLFLDRLLKKILRIDIDPEHKVTTGWEYNRNNVVTRVVVGVLNFDYYVCECLSKIRINIPGLSLIAICRKG